MVLTRTKVLEVGKEMDAVIEAKAAELGINVDKGCGSRYNSITGEITFKFAVTVPIDGFEEAKYQRNDRYANFLGLNKKVGDVFRSLNGWNFQITGISMRRPKYPVSASRVPDGKGFKFPVHQVNFFQKVNKDGSLTNSSV